MNRRLTSPVEQFSVLDCPDRNDLRFIEERIDEENIARTGIADARQLAIILRSATSGIVAGLHGWTWGGTCEIKALWVHPLWRGRGLGTQLMLAAEAEARSRGASQMVLSTHSFQAPHFYRQLGFEVDGCVDDYPIGHASFYLRKRL